MSYTSEMYDAWRKARIKFIKDNPATARALGLTVPSMTDDEQRAAVNAGMTEQDNSTEASDD